MSKKDFTYILLIIIFGIFGLKSLLHQGFFTSLDGWHNVARLYHFDKALKEGQIPPRWSGDLANGYGYPLFVFSYHAPWIIAQPFMLMGFDIFTSIKIVFFIGFIFSGIFMYLWLKKLLNQEAGFAAAIIYLFTPYRFAKILVGASVGEATVFLFLPLLFCGFTNLGENNNRKYIIIGSIGLAGIIMSHFMLVPLIAPFILLTCLFLIRQSNDRKLYLQQFILLIIAGLGLSFYYWFPLVSYNSAIKAKSMQVSFGSLYENHFVNLSQLIYSKWGFGPIVKSAKDGEVSFQIGIAQWLALFICLLTLFIQKLRLNFLLPIIRKTDPRKRNLIFVFIFSFILSIILMLDISKPLWKLTSRYFTVDYPWRYLSLTAFFGSILCGFAVYFLKKYSLLGIILFIAVALFTNKNHLNVNQYTDIPLSLYISSEITTNTFSEYLPIFSRVDIFQKPTKIISNDTGLIINNMIKDSKKLHFDILLPSFTPIEINYLYFPGQVVYSDGKKTEFTYKGDGRIYIPLNSGKHTVDIIFEQSMLMKIANYISVITVFSLLIYFFSHFHADDSQNKTNHEKAKK